MKIAVYDIDYKSSIKLKNLLYIYSDYKKADYVVDVFTDCTNMYALADDYSLIFLSLENDSSKQIAKLLYKKGIGQKTVVMAIDCRLAVDAFKLDAFSFLQKPFCEASVFTILEKFFNLYLSVLPMLIHSERQNICLNICDILYLEASNKHSIIHLKNQTVICTKAMGKVYDALPKSCFSKINRAYVVNLKHILSFNSENVILSNKEALHPSRHFYKSFKTEYLQMQNPKIP